MVRYFFEFKPGRVFRIGRNSSFSKWTDSTKVATLVVEGKTYYGATQWFSGNDIPCELVFTVKESPRTVNGYKIRYKDGEMHGIDLVGRLAHNLFPTAVSCMLLSAGRVLMAIPEGYVDDPFHGVFKKGVPLLLTPFLGTKVIEY